MNIPKLQMILPVFALLLLLPVPTAVRAEAPGAADQDSSEKKTERVKAFLLRSSDDVSKSWAFVNESTALLKDQTEPAPGRQSESKTEERVALLGWYQQYSGWLKGMSAELDVNVNNYFIRPKKGGDLIVWYGKLTKNYQNSDEELSGTLQKLEEEKKKTEALMQKLNTAVVERRVIIANGDLELARELWPKTFLTYRVSNDHPDKKHKEAYKELFEDEVLRLQDELISLGERLKYFECLTELGNYEQGWLDIKSEDSMRLSELARIVGSNDPGEVTYAIKEIMKTYEANITTLKKKSGELDAKMRGITRSGTLRTLDRYNELTRYYEQMKSRFDRQIEWLKVQIGNYQVDLGRTGQRAIICKLIINKKEKY